MKQIFIDKRWEKLGGIGTFSKGISRFNSYFDVDFSGNPTSPIDCIRTSFFLKKKLSSNSLVFFPGYIPPLFSSYKYIFTIHDLNHLDRDENSGLFKKIFYNLIIKRGCRKAEYIFTVSEFSKSRIAEWAGVAPNKIVNVSNGVSDEFSPEGDSYHYDFSYILCVSNRKGHKNENGTLEAFAKAKIDTSVRLVFTGKENDDILEKIQSLGISERVIFTGHVSEADLPKLYRTAIGVIFVSFYEGFGLPVIEAQASGVPVITSNTSSLKEVAGDGAILVNPYDIDQISNSIEFLLGDNSEEIKSLIVRGYRNSKLYNWKKTADLVDEYIKKAINC